MAHPVLRERLFDCEHFELWRWRGEKQFMVGAAGAPRVLVSTAGAAQLEYSGVIYDVSQGDVLLLPAAVGACSYKPHGAVSLLEIAIPEAASRSFPNLA